MSIPLVRTISDLRRTVNGWRASGFRIAVVPTMGALHEGHLSLVRTALQATDRVIVTLFVNPKQFNSAGDLTAYPRTENEDALKLASLGVHLLYCPDVDEIYPPRFATTVSVSGVGEGLCGAFRPGHFDGVATVVAKLLLQTGATTAYFGEKDFQQLHVVRRLVADLNIPVDVVGCPTIRDEDGLALSSRNSRLSRSERAIAPTLSQELLRAAEKISSGSHIDTVLAYARSRILWAGYQSVEYLEFRGEDDLEPLCDLSRPGRLLAAAWLGETRLIDNVIVRPRSNGAADES